MGGVPLDFQDIGRIHNRDPYNGLLCVGFLPSLTRGPLFNCSTVWLSFSENGIPQVSLRYSDFNLHDMLGSEKEYQADC